MELTGIEADRYIHNLFLKRMMDNKYEFLELTKLVQPATDEYRYIRMRYNNADLLPIGVGAGGRIGNIGIYNMLVNRTMLNEIHQAQNRYNRFLGIMQFGIYDIEVMKKLLSPECTEVLEAEIKNLVHKGFMKATKPAVFELTDNGIFWGNNIAALILEKLIKHEFPRIKKIA